MLKDMPKKYDTIIATRDIHDITGTIFENTRGIVKLEKPNNQLLIQFDKHNYLVIVNADDVEIQE